MRRKVGIVILAHAMAGAVSLGCQDAYRAMQEYREARYLRNVTEEYRFLFKSVENWVVAKPRAGAALSLSRAGADNKVVSTADVRTLEKTFSAPLSQEDEQLLKEMCREIRGEVDSRIPVNENPEEIIVNDMRAYRCSFEAPALNVNEIYTYGTCIFVSPEGHPYDYVVTTGYPKNNELEGQKVKRLVESFTIVR